jgi:hypothetical protein
MDADLGSARVGAEFAASVEHFRSTNSRNTVPSNERTGRAAKRGAASPRLTSVDTASPGLLVARDAPRPRPKRERERSDGPGAG